MARIHPRTWDDGVMPLEEFPAEKREQIERQVAAGLPPRRWIRLGLAEIESRAWWEWHWARGRKLWRVGETLRQSRPRIPDTIRLAVYERDGFRCLHCGTTERLSLDHIHPWSLGGTDTIENLQTLCQPCNSRKGATV
jgi:hypothetical protein